MRRSCFVVLLSAWLTGLVVPSFARAEGRPDEAAEHPRIAKAIVELEDAIKYLEEAPNDFGGHKAKAIAASRAAVRQLRAALRYRARQDTKPAR